MAIDGTEIKIQSGLITAFPGCLDPRCAYLTLDQMQDAIVNNEFYLYPGCIGYCQETQRYYTYVKDLKIWKDFGASNIVSVDYSDVYNEFGDVVQYGGHLTCRDLDGNIVYECNVPISLDSDLSAMRDDTTGEVIKWKGTLLYNGKELLCNRILETYRKMDLFPRLGDEYTLYYSIENDTVYRWNDAIRMYVPLTKYRTGVALFTKVAQNDKENDYYITKTYNPLEDEVVVSKNGLTYNKEDYIMLLDENTQEWYIHFSDDEANKILQGDEFSVQVYNGLDMGMGTASNVSFNIRKPDGTLWFDFNKFGAVNTVQDAIEKLKWDADEIWILLEGTLGSNRYIGVFDDKEALADYTALNTIAPNSWCIVTSHSDYGDRKVKMVYSVETDAQGNIMSQGFVFGGFLEDAIIELNDSKITKNNVWSARKSVDTFRPNYIPIFFNEVHDGTFLIKEGNIQLDDAGNPIYDPDHYLTELHKLIKLFDVNITEQEVDVINNPDQIGKVVSLGTQGKFILQTMSSGMYSDRTDVGASELGGIQGGWRPTDENGNYVDVNGEPIQMPMEQVLFKLLHGDVQPSIDMILDPPAGTYAPGSTIRNATLTVKFNKAVYPLQLGKVTTSGGTVALGEYDVNDLANTREYVFNLGDITTSQIYDANLADVLGTTATAKTMYRFCPGIVIGSASKEKLEDTNVQVVDFNNFSVNTPRKEGVEVFEESTNNIESLCCFFIALPKGYGFTIKQIVDKNGNILELPKDMVEHEAGNITALTNTIYEVYYYDIPCTYGGKYSVTIRNNW